MHIIPVLQRFKRQQPCNGKIVPNLQREGAAEWIKASSDLQLVPKKFNSTAANPGECLFTPKFTTNPMNCKKNTPVI